MRKDSFWKAAGSALLAALLVAACGEDDTEIRSTATVALVDSTGKSVGTATLAENRKGIVNLTVEVNGLPAGEHGIHFHEVGIADPKARPPFSTAGEHYNPTAEEHGIENPNGTHAGDLPNLLINAQGTGRLETTTNRISLSEGQRTLFDANGSTLIIHAARDDQRTNPAGNSGARIAGGVVVRN